MTYRKDIDFLRALAVIGIFLYHMSADIFSGGFVFLELFFVISGYLITSIIVTALYESRFTIKTFYINRFFRLFPTLISIILLTLFCGYFVLRPTDFKELALSAFTAIFSFSNFHFWHQVDYFDPDKYFKPLLHTWSLALEEQFYLIWPALLVLCFKINQSLKSFYILISMLFLLSLGISVLWSYSEAMSSAAYFLLPSRIFEFCVGAFLAITLKDAKRHSGTSPLSKPLITIFQHIQSPIIADVIFLAGLCLLFIAASALTTDAYYPGYLAMIPCCSALLCLISGEHSRLASWLSTGVMVFTGKISYGLYLIHWPVIVFYQYNLDRPLNISDQVLIFAISYFLAFLVHGFIEQPFRQKPGPFGKISKKLMIPSLKMGAMICFFFALCGVGISVFIYANEGGRSRIHNDIQTALVNLEKDFKARKKIIRAPQCHYSTSESFNSYLSRFNECNIIKNKNIVIMGDSHAADVYAALATALPNISFIQLTRGNCSIQHDNKKHHKKCQDIQNFARNFAIENRNKVDAFIYKVRGKNILRKNNKKTIQLDENNIQATDDFLSIIAQQGIHVIWLGPEVEIKRGFHNMLEKSNSLADAVLRSQNSRLTQQASLIDHALKERFEGRNINYISTDDICNGPCPLLTDEGVPIFVDYGHWGERGIIFMGTVLKHSDALEFIFQD